MIMKKNIVVGLLLFLVSSCSLDYPNNSVISPDDVWRDKTMVNAFLTDIYGRMLPGWPIAGNGTDEAMDAPRNMSEFDLGHFSVAQNGQGLSYGNIDRINFFLDQLEQTTVLTETEYNQMKGQALFWRAWDYWGKVWNLGGVPLILHFQDVTDVESLFLPRNSTTECVAQILKDLDDAISLLPDTWTGDNYGRIDKGIAMAYKGRVLLQYASPLFNPNHDTARWQQAYDANKAAVDFLKAHGKGLYQGQFEDIWYDELNCEVVMVNQYYYPDHVYSQYMTRPEPLTKDWSNFNQAIYPLLMAYPKLDGSKLELDINRLAVDPAYNEQFLTDFYMGRDPRFYATIFCPGTVYPTEEPLVKGMSYWNTWKQIPDPGTGELVYQSMTYEQINRGVGNSNSGYFQKKGIDKSLAVVNVHEAETDWIEIRFAEVLMNYGECANELGKSDEALDVLYQIRKRAGIQDSGSGKYGITATSTDEIRQAYMDERFIEFAYEGKRRTDLRRWKRYDILNTMKTRACLYPVLKDNKNLEGFDWTKDMYDPEVRKLFRMDYIPNADNDDYYTFNLPLDHWFAPISQGNLDRNSLWEQNNEWGGTFDPLK